jgi:phage FluMu protein Com
MKNYQNLEQVDSTDDVIVEYPTKYVAVRNSSTLRCNKCGNTLNDEQTYIRLNYCPCCGKKVEEIVSDVYHWDSEIERMIVS